ncbi:hypothetical protein JHK82_042473 [Glycine max]|uniref:Uncharacterized protein n=2 Tax=Glycine subgen. Soja TaxID=1462606 RepID=A0A0R0G815_SOYBN|nr:hypothetical protein JHK86_042506 [Glycine max]RZB64825.1 hypothetical protein D0Y65_041057 [Glycine soja]KAG4956759.1 hypothetical protein JHK85_043139 [Glycine max]KAG5105503.1 hypothetical protein JHK82_042473 [Glycine max]KAG5116618.1 hypothetical protein JHK84_042731 [Glycine max]
MLFVILQGLLHGAITPTLHPQGLNCQLFKKSFQGGSVMMSNIFHVPRLSIKKMFSGLPKRQAYS